MKDLKIGAAIMVNNMEKTISSCITSANWTDGVYVFDDHCEDNSIELVKKYSRTNLEIEKSPFEKTAFENGELETRNYVIKKAFEILKVDALILLDADEMISNILKPVIISAFSNENINTIAFNIWHLYTNKKYIHLWETCINNIFMVDPHIRVIKRGVEFQSRYSDGSHPGIKFTEKTLCLNGAYHFHLKYLKKLGLPNYSFHFLPKFINDKDVKPLLRDLNFTLPSDIKNGFKLLKKMNATKDFQHHREMRIALKDYSEALIHPRDRK